MVNWNDPGTVASNYASLVKLTHVFGGIYIWEFYTHLDFDWSIVSGKRPYRWTFWLYLNCRLSGILALITMFAGFDVTHKINCQAWVTFAFSLGYSAFACASALIVLRIMAIWERRRPIVALAVAVWIINIAFIIRSIIVTRGAWNAEGHFCEVLNTSMSKENIIVTTMTDIILLLLMFFGLLRWRSVSGGLVGGIWRLLYTQGIWWIVIVTVSEIPPCVLIILNLNDAFNLMFQVPGLIIMAIGASRIYRGLADYSSIDDLQISSIVKLLDTPVEKTDEQNGFHTHDPAVYVEPVGLDTSSLPKDPLRTTTTMV